MSPTATLPVPTLSPEVLAFAEEKDVAEYLPAVAAMVRHLHPHRQINVRIDQDPELDYNRTVLFEVEDSGMTEEETLDAYRQWSAQIVEHCPTTHTHLFGMMLVP